MSGKNVLRLAIGLHWFSGVVSVVLSFLLAGRLPTELQSWNAAEMARDVTVVDVLALGALSLSILAAIVGSVALFLLHRWGAWVWLASEALCYVVYPFTGPTVEHALSDTFDEISVLLSGFILGVAFFSDVLRRRSGFTDHPSVPSPHPPDKARISPPLSQVDA